MFKKSLIAVASLLAAVGTAQACSTLVIGKAVSETGNIIVAHNEDNGGRLFNMQHYVPPAKHKKGEMLKFEKFAAEIPQVEETLGFYWTQTFVPDGASFADGFFNDAGVVVATNWCGEIFDADRMEVKADGDGTVDFALLGAKGHEVLSANMEATRAGMSANQLNSTRQWKNFAPAEKMVYKDVNNDGITDVVFTFKAKDVTKGAVAGAAMDLWLYTQINGHRVTGFDVVPVENDKVKMHKGARDGKGLL